MVANLETPYRIFYIANQTLLTFGTFFFFFLTICLTFLRNPKITKYMQLVMTLCFWGMLYQILRSAVITASPFLDIHWIYQVIPIEISTILFRLECSASAAERTILTMTFVQRWIFLKKPQWQYQFYFVTVVVVLSDIAFYNIWIVGDLFKVESCLFTCTNDNLTAMLVVASMQDEETDFGINSAYLTLIESFLLFAIMLFCLISIWRHFRNLKSASPAVYRMERRLCFTMILQLLILIVPDLVFLPAIIALSSVIDNYQVDPLVNAAICGIFIGILNWYQFIWAYLIYWGHKGFYVKKDGSKTAWFSKKSVSNQKS